MNYDNDGNRESRPAHLDLFIACEDCWYWPMKISSATAILSRYLMILFAVACAANAVTAPAQSPHSTSSRTHAAHVGPAEQQASPAETALRNILRTDPSNQDANYHLGILLLKDAEPAKAIPYLRAISPPNLEANFALVRAYLQTSHTTAALKLADQISAKHEHDPQLHLSLGVLLASEKQYKPAQIELEKALVLQPADFEILSQLGQTSLLNGDTERADLALSQALKLQPDSAQTLSALAEAYTKEQRPLDALNLLIRANKLSPANPDILYAMANISMSQKFYEDAIPLLEKAVLISPARVDLHAALGECYFRAGKFDRAATEFSTTISSHPSAREYSFLGLSHIYLGRFEDAKHDFHNCLALDPNTSFCLFELGDIAKMQGNVAHATTIFLKVLRSNPNYPRALLQLADIRIQARQFTEAALLLHRYVQVSDSPATGYYKLATVDNNLHKPEAAALDLRKFQALSKDDPITSRPYDHLFDDLSSRSQVTPGAHTQESLNELRAEATSHPDRPDILIALAGAYLEARQAAEAKETIAKIDAIASGDSRLLMEAGVLLARHHLYDDAIVQFTAAQNCSPPSNDAAFDLATAYLRVGRYSDALDAALRVNEQERQDSAYLALLADIYGHLNQTQKADQLYHDAIARNPDDDQNYLSLALLDLRSGDTESAKRILLSGQTRIPASGKIMWGLGLVSALQGNTTISATLLERAVDMLPEWQGAYSTLGFFYYQTGQIAKAKEVFERFKNSGAQSGLDLSRIESVLSQANVSSASSNNPLSPAQRSQLLQFALVIADRTL